MKTTESEGKKRARRTFVEVDQIAKAATDIQRAQPGREWIEILSEVFELGAAEARWLNQVPDLPTEGRAADVELYRAAGSIRGAAFRAAHRFGDAAARADEFLSEALVIDDGFREAFLEAFLGSAGEPDANNGLREFFARPQFASASRAKGQPS